jgi:hypothetical protein
VFLKWSLKVLTPNLLLISQSKCMLHVPPIHSRRFYCLYFAKIAN